MGRGGGPPPPPPRGRGGDRFGSPRGRGYFPGNHSNDSRDNRFIGGQPPMGRGPMQMGRGGFVPPGRGNIPPPPPMPRNNNTGRGIPPPPPPRNHQGGRGMPPSMSPMLQAQQPPPVVAIFGQAGFNRYPQHNNPPPHGMGPPVIQQQHMHQPPMHQIQQQQQHSRGPVPPQQYPTPHAPMQQPVFPQPAVGHQPAESSSSFSKIQIDKAWTEHTAPNSMKYYYNGLTQESTYTKPTALTPNSVVPAITKKAPVVQKWTEYTEAATGKTYYSDGVQTTWEKPDGYQELPGAEPEFSEPPKKKKKTAPRKESDFSSKSEATAAFKGLLLAKDIQPTTKWNEVVKVCSADSRWEPCLVLTQGERKQALAEYQTKRANELRDREREERMRAKGAFAKLLSDILPSIESFNPMASRFMEVRDSLSKDDRFYAVEDEPTRETLFLEFCEEVRKRDERKRRNLKRDAKDALFSFLREHEDSGQLTFASIW
jgi:pre-mRNA-processing factor 40